jgi:hypothetical protein
MMLRRNFFRAFPISLVAPVVAVRPSEVDSPFFLHPDHVKLIKNSKKVNVFLKRFPTGCILNQENVDVLINECGWSIYDFLHAKLPITGRVVSDGAQYWCKGGQLHREDGPAVEYANGNKSWYKDGKLHREDGPALIICGGAQYWYKDGKLHREGGPAVEYSDGSSSWYKDGWPYNQ